MKTIQNKQSTSYDAMAEAKKHKDFQKHSDAAAAKIRLAVEVYNARINKQLSQQQLADMVQTTQKIISNIENADVNIGLSLLNRLVKCLDFNSSILALIFDCQAFWNFNDTHSLTQSRTYNKEYELTNK